MFHHLIRYYSIGQSNVYLIFSSILHESFTQGFLRAHSPLAEISMFSVIMALQSYDTPQLAPLLKWSSHSVYSLIDI